MPRRSIKLAPRSKPRDGSNAPAAQSDDVECLTCFDLDLQLIPQPHTNNRICSIGQAARHWIKSADLTKNPSCPSCQFLKSAIETLVTSATSARDIPYSIAIIDQNAENDEFDKQDTRQGTKSLMIVMRCNPGGAAFDEEFEVEIYTPSETPCIQWKAIGHAGEVPTNPTAEEAAAIAKRWLGDCNRTHILCHRDATSTTEEELLPRRVLDLSDGHIRLIETTAGQRGHYVALSHCWGKEQLLITTRDTLADRMGGIDMHQLPRTFQDAVTVTRGLDIRYIWIDSLCIIQKDAQDWEEQSAIMADIYARCYLNIAATRAAGGHEGFLKARYTRRDSLQWTRDYLRQMSHGTDREHHVPKIREFEVKSYRIPGVEEDIRVRLALKSSHEALQTARWLRQHQETAPLLPRAWVYQERNLAPRSLHMHSSEMIWICNMMQRCECTVLNTIPLGGDRWSVTKDQVAKLNEIGDRKVIHGFWRTIVEDVSILDLTVESDRLPALSGLASRFSEQFPSNERYLAGLWEGDLLRDLLWESGGGQQMDGPSRERIPGIPSWSWASLKWGGNHPSGLDWEYETKPKLAKWAGTTSYKQDSRVKFNSASVEVPGKNIYGVVSAGSINLEGPLCGVLKEGDDETREVQQAASTASVVSDMVTIASSKFNSLHLNFDTPESSQESEGEIVYCLLIGSFKEVFDSRDDEHVQLCGLMLKPTVEGKFERIGRWKQYIESWSKKKTVWTKQATVVRVEII